MGVLMSRREMNHAIGKFIGIKSNKLLSQEFVDVLIELHGVELARQLFVDWLTTITVGNHIYNRPTIYMAFPFKSARMALENTRVAKIVLSDELKLPAHVTYYTKESIRRMGRFSFNALNHLKTNMFTVMIPAQYTENGRPVRCSLATPPELQSEYFSPVYGRIFDRLADKTHAGLTTNNFVQRVHTPLNRFLSEAKEHLRLEDCSSIEFCDRFLG